MKLITMVVLGGKRFLLRSGVRPDEFLEVFAGALEVEQDYRGRRRVINDGEEAEFEVVTLPESKIEFPTPPEPEAEAVNPEARRAEEERARAEVPL